MPEAPATPPPPPAASRTPLSACIIAFNEADRIGDCLASLAFCDEIVVVDSGSVDGPRELCERLGARVLQRPFDGFRSQTPRKHVGEGTRVAGSVDPGGRLKI